MNLPPDVDPIPEPTALRSSGGNNVYRHTGRDHYTSQRVLGAEQRIVAAAGCFDSLAWSSDEVELSILAAAVDGVRLNRGKTTAMQVIANVWTEGDDNVLGLVPSAAAAAALAEATGMPCETFAKLTHDPNHLRRSDLVVPSVRGRSW